MVAFEDAVRDELNAFRQPSWREPFHWWGPSWHRHERRGLDELVGEGVLTLAASDMLRGAVVAGGSVVVAAGPSRAGKSTLARALTEAVAGDRTRVYVRGSYETFDFLDTTGPSGSALLVNEISPHLPIYLWGKAARRTLQLAREGAQLIGTIHAGSPEEVVYQLAREPVAATPDEIAALGTVVFLGPPASEGHGLWRVERVVQLRTTAHGVGVDDVA